jgi:hypothetical protein
MSYTIIFAVLALIILAMLFAIIWRIRGLKSAFLVTGVMLVVFILMYVAFIYYAASVM